MNKYEAYLATQPRAKNRLLVGMHVVLKCGQRYVITNESEGRYWGEREDYATISSSYQGWYWTEEGQYYSYERIADVDWAATEEVYGEQV